MKQLTVIAFDPATSCGWATRDGSGVWDLTPASSAPSKGRTAEPEWSRCGKLWEQLQTMREEHQDDSVVVFCENANGFTRFPHTLKIGHELRGVIKAFCHQSCWKYVEVAPTTLKKWATGSGKAGKADMVQQAKQYKPSVTSDDEADAILIRQFGLAQLESLDFPR